MSALHRIRRQRWQVTAASAVDAFAIRSTLRRENELSLLPALEIAFAALDDGRRDICLPRLDIAINISSLDKLAEELPAKLAEATRQALAEALAVAPQTAAATPRDLTPAGRLRRYLNSGQVDWFDADRDHAQLRQQLADEARLWSASPAAAWPCLLVDLAQDGRGRREAFFRFLHLLDDAGRAAWWDFGVRMAEASGGEFTAPLAALHQLQAGRPADHALRLLVLGLVLLAAYPSTAPRRCAEWSDAVDACARQLGPLSAVDRKNWLTIETLFSDDEAPSTPSQDVRPDSRQALSRPARPSGKFEISPNFPVQGDAALGLPLRSAGLLLLHPYLPRLFSALGWVSAGHRQGEAFPLASLPRAAALLNWLATGRDEPFEFELGTAKLLLGLNPDDALPVAAGLIGEAEREEGEALLGAVVEHWSALGKTSIDGLRVAFLQRGGLLYPAADGWLLRPQAETFDLLIDRLPWGISIIRLPWMPRSLHTEWLSA